MRLLATCLGLAVVGAGEPGEQTRPNVHRWRIDTSTSRLTVHVFKKGILSPSLHDHLFSPTSWVGSLEFDPTAPDREPVRVEVSVAAASLHDHEPGLSDKDRAKVEAQVQSRDILDTAKYPQIRFESREVRLGRPAGDGSVQAELTGQFELHGVRQIVRIPMRARWSSQELQADGTLVLRQSDFGIRPYSKALGTIAVQDRVEVNLSIHAVPTEGGATVSQVEDFETGPVRTLTCYTAARSTILDEGQRFQLCQGASTAAPVGCFERAHLLTTLDTQQSIVLCRCAFDTSPVDCYDLGRQDATLDTDQVVVLCSTIAQYQLSPNCIPIWGTPSWGSRGSVSGSMSRATASRW
jgi:polyisoprenoid-binding protein YceI